jgi:hypothetical protein
MMRGLRGLALRRCEQYGNALDEPRSVALDADHGRRSAARRGRGVPVAWLAVCAVVGWNALSLRAETRAVPYLNDSSVHEQMVRFATAQFQSGHLPLTRWFPYLGLGSPQFLHYQSLPAMLAGLLGLMLGPNTAFLLTLYLLLCLWPVSVYVGARLFDIPRPAAAAAAVAGAFVMSRIGVGYEQNAYIWVGYGVWAQLWASLSLPAAWGLSFRAIRDGRRYASAALAVAATLAFHFETGYLAVLPLLLWPFITPRALVRRAARAVLICGGALMACAWVIVPLLAQRDWAATNEILKGTPLVNGYGASRVVGWLTSGQLLDAGRVPVLTVLFGLGLAVCCARFRRDESARALVVLFAACLVLSFGPATLGPLADVGKALDRLYPYRPAGRTDAR